MAAETGPEVLSEVAAHLCSSSCMSRAARRPSRPPLPLPPALVARGGGGGKQAGPRYEQGCEWQQRDQGRITPRFSQHRQPVEGAGEGGGKVAAALRYVCNQS